MLCAVAFVAAANDYNVDNDIAIHADSNAVDLHVGPEISVSNANESEDSESMRPEKAKYNFNTSESKTVKYSAPDRYDKKISI
jgi:hypothetical protein